MPTIHQGSEIIIKNLSTEWVDISLQIWQYATTKKGGEICKEKAGAQEVRDSCNG